jgi:leucyl aminopeptidase (aminopeptidase T)
MRVSMLTEGRDEYYAFELARAARKLAEDVLEVKPGQNVVITADSQSDARVVWADATAIFAAGGTPVVIFYPSQPRPQMEPPAPVAAALTKADIWIEHSVNYIMYTHAWHEALEAGVLYCELGGMDADGMVRCIGQQNIRLLAEMGERIVRLMSNCQNVRITSEAGTDISFSDEGIQVGSFKMRTNPEKIPIMLAGQVSWLPVETSVSGRIIADGIVYPPAEVGLVQEPVEINVEGGKITSINGGREAKLTATWVKNLNDPTMNRVAHVSMGFNPGIMVPTGRVMEDERAFGDIDFGFGAWVGRPAAGHFDITMRSVSLWVDGVQVLNSGIFVHPELAPLCREMGVPRH